MTAPGQYAVRGDIVDIFVDGDYPTRVEFFDDEIEKILNFDFSTMKTMKMCEKIEILPIFLKIGKNSVFDICENCVIDEPIKIENECKILEKAREQLSWTRDDLFVDFSKIDLEKFITFSNTSESEFENQIAHWKRRNGKERIN